MYRCGSQGHGLVADVAVLVQWLDFMFLGVFSNLSNSLILWLCVISLLNTLPQDIAVVVNTNVGIPDC